MTDAYNAYITRELQNEEREITSYLTDAQADQIADEIRAKAAEAEAAADIAEQFRAENETLRERVTMLELLAISEEQGWTDASDRATLRKLVPGLNHSTPQSAAILRRVIHQYTQRAA